MHVVTHLQCEAWPPVQQLANGLKVLGPMPFLEGTVAQRLRGVR